MGGVRYVEQSTSTFMQEEEGSGDAVGGMWSRGEEEHADSLSEGERGGVWEGVWVMWAMVFAAELRSENERAQQGHLGGSMGDGFGCW